MASITSYTKAALDTKLALLSTLDSPIFTGTPQLPTGATAVTQATSDSTTKVATTAFVQAVVTALINGAPGALDTLNELATALGDDANFATTMTTALALKAPLASPTFTGDPKAPTASTGDSDTSIATTGFVQNEKNVQINSQSGTTYTLIGSDNHKVVEINNASAITVTVPLNATVAYLVGSEIKFTQRGAGKITLSPAAGATINSPGGLLGCRVQYSTITLRLRATDTWVLSGDVG